MAKMARAGVESADLELCPRCGHWGEPIGKCETGEIRQCESRVCEISWAIAEENGRRFRFAPEKGRIGRLPAYLAGKYIDEAYPPFIAEQRRFREEAERTARNDAAARAKDLAEKKHLVCLEQFCPFLRDPSKVTPGAAFCDCGTQLKWIPVRAVWYCPKPAAPGAEQVKAQTCTHARQVFGPEKRSCPGCGGELAWALPEDLGIKPEEPAAKSAKKTK